MNLKPWREVMTPHPDVAAGRYQQAEFAADLAQVTAGAAEAEYGDPVEFFARTYLTEGMRRLLVTALERLAGRGGEPVVQLKTVFGGGKTHTMLAVYHLLGSGARAGRLAGVAGLLREAGLNELPSARLAVIVGTALSPSKARTVNGLTVHTLWGDIAAQLGGAEGYRLVESDDRRGVSPGADDLTALFDRFGPAVVLIDELVAYARNIYGVSGLPAGSFDANMTFIQALTEAARRSGRSLVVAAIPESDIEIGGEGGRATLARIEHVFGRLEQIWKPVGALEGFEVVRRRLFGPVADESVRDAVCRAFVALYEENPTDFPPESREAAYLDRLRAAYPIHPELFDRLYDDWSSLERFQRTRGVLRLMAAVIHELWGANDRSLLIMPGSLPLDAPAVRNELLRYLPEGWNAIVDRDVDGERSEPHAIDQSNSRFGKYLAARRMARAIFLGSAPHVRQMTVRGIEDVRVRLGVAQPGEPISVFNDALSKLESRLTHLYSGNRRYWYDTQPNLRRTMEDRAGRLQGPDVEAEIVRRLRQIRERGNFRAVHICPVSSGDVPDEQHVRLVVLLPSAPHRNNRTPDHPAQTPALSRAAEILDRRGNGPRLHRNMLLFVASDAELTQDLEQETRRYLAWASIVEDADTLNLDAHQRREATQGRDRANETLATKLNDAYCWLLVPAQEGAGPLTWETVRIAGGQDNPVVKASRKASSDQYIITHWSPMLLKMELDKWLWQDQPHVSLKRVWDCLTTYLYLPRLQDEDVFLLAVREGMRSRDFFAYARGVGKDGRYQGLEYGSSGASLSSIYLDESSLLVRPEVAAQQLEAERVPVAPPPPSGYPPDSTPVGSSIRNGPFQGSVEIGVAASVRPTRFYGAVRLDATRVGRDVAQVAEEVIQHLVSLMGAEVEVTLEIQARIPSGVPDNIERTVTENCNTLGFTTHGFERE